MGENIVQKPVGFVNTVKDFCAPIGQPSWTRDKLDAMAESANAGLKAVDRTIQNAFNRIDKAIEKDPKLPEKVVYGAMLGYQSFAASHEPQTISVAQGIVDACLLSGYVYAHRMLGMATIGKNAIIEDVVNSK